jgi:hypothetical protein
VYIALANFWATLKAPWILGWRDLRPKYLVIFGNAKRLGQKSLSMRMEKHAPPETLSLIYINK